MENVGGSGDDGWRRRWLRLAPAVAWAVAENMNLKMAALGQINLGQKRVALDYNGNRGRLPMQLCTELRSATVRSAPTPIRRPSHLGLASKLARGSNFAILQFYSLMTLVYANLF